MAGEIRKPQKVTVRSMYNGAVGNSKGSNLGIGNEITACRSCSR